MDKFLEKLKEYDFEGKLKKLLELLKSKASLVVEKFKGLDSKKQLIVSGAGLIVLILLICGLKSCGGEKYRSVKLEGFKGSVNLTRENNQDEKFTGEVYEGMNLVSEDYFTTYTDAQATLLVDKDKHIVAEENTSFRIVATGSAKKGMVTIKLDSGEALYTIDNKLKKNSTFEVHTPNAVLAVRGTTFRVNYDSYYDITDVEVIEGKVWLSAGGKEEVLEAGDYASVWGEDVKRYDNGVKPEDKVKKPTEVVSNDSDSDDNDNDEKPSEGGWKGAYKAILSDPYEWLDSHADLDYSSSGLKYQYSLVDFYDDGLPELVVYVYGDFGGNGRYNPFYIITYDDEAKYLCGDYMEVSSNLGVYDGTPAISSISNGTGDWSVYEMKLSEGSFGLGERLSKGSYSSIDSMWPDETKVAQYIDVDDYSAFDAY